MFGSTLSHRSLLFAAFTLLALTQVGEARAQDRTTPLNVFLDCQTRGCDRQSFIAEIPFVNWVVVQEEADVHVIMTSQSAGGSTQWVWDFESVTATDEGSSGPASINVSTPNTDTDAEELDSKVRTLALGLAAHAQARGFQGFEIRGTSDSGASDTGEPVEDPWNSWVFRTSLNGSTDRESSQRFRSGFANISANRVTEEWRVRVQANARHRRSEFDTSDSTSIVSETNDWGSSLTAVKSFGDHWGFGGVVTTGQSTFQNKDLYFRVGPAIEWNYFPYEQANRRRLIAFYRVTAENIHYIEETLYEKTQETLFEHQLSLSYRARESWGEAEAAVITAQYFNDPSFWRVSLAGEIDYRIARGLSISLEADASWIRNQLFLPSRDASEEEILLRRRRLSSDFDTSFQIGFSYTFGSIFNNVVNNRFPSEFGFSR